MYASSLSRGCHHASRGCQLYYNAASPAARPGRGVQRRHRSASAVSPAVLPASSSTTTCAACGSARVAAARSASTALHLRGAGAAPASADPAGREARRAGGVPGAAPARAIHAAARVGPAAAGPAGTVSLEARAALLGGEDPSPSWSARELTGAILFAGAATAASILLGPIDALRGKKSGPGGGGGPGGDGGGGGVPPLGGKRYENAFESQPKERLDEQKKLSLEVATSSRPYEVRNGRVTV